MPVLVDTTATPQRSSLGRIGKSTARCSAPLWAKSNGWRKTSRRFSINPQRRRQQPPEIETQNTPPQPRRGVRDIQKNNAKPHLSKGADGVVLVKRRDRLKSVPMPAP